jgi:hypothetical protein
LHPLTPARKINYARASSTRELLLHTLLHILLSLFYIYSHSSARRSRLSALTRAVCVLLHVQQVLTKYYTHMCGDLCAHACCMRSLSHTRRVALLCSMAYIYISHGLWYISQMVYAHPHTCCAHPHTCCAHPHTCCAHPHTCCAHPHTCNSHPHTCGAHANIGDAQPILPPWHCLALAD